MSLNFISSARLLLDTVQEAAVALGVELPERRILTAGGVVYDCELVAVSAISSATGMAASGSMSALGPCGTVWRNELEIAIVICSAETISGPRGQIAPTPAQIETDTENVSKLADVIAETAILLTNSETVGEPTFSLQYGQPQGGLIAVVASVSMNSWATEGDE